MSSLRRFFFMAAVITAISGAILSFSCLPNLDESQMQTRTDDSPDLSLGKIPDLIVIRDLRRSRITLTSITPSRGLKNKQTQVEIIGEGFNSDTKVFVDKQEAFFEGLEGDHKLTVRVPMGTRLGPVPVSIGEGEDQKESIFTYYAENILFASEGNVTSSVANPKLVVIKKPPGTTLPIAFLAKVGGTIMNTIAPATSCKQPFPCDGSANLDERGIYTDSLSLVVARFSATSNLDILISRRDNIRMYIHDGTSYQSTNVKLGAVEYTNCLVNSYIQDKSIVLLDQGKNKLVSLIYDSPKGFTLKAEKSIGSGTSAYNIAVGLLNKDDTIPDVAITRYEQGDVFLIRGTGRENDPFDFFITKTVSVSDKPTLVLIDDIDKDGLSDLVVVNESAAFLELLFGKGDGSFENRREVTYGPGKIAALRSADLDGDGFPELIFVTDKSDSFSVLRNNRERGKPFESVPLVFTAPGQHPSLDVADVNNDALPDVVVTNAGRADSDPDVSFYLNDSNK